MQSAETVANLQKFLSLLDPSLHLEEMLTNVARQLVEMFKVDHSGVLFFGYDDVEGEVVAEYPDHGAVGLRLSLIGYPLAAAPVEPPVEPQPKPTPAPRPSPPPQLEIEVEDFAEASLGDELESLVDLTADLEKDVTEDKVNAAMKEASEGPLRGILAYSEEPIVSIDINHTSYSSIFDSPLTKVIEGRLVKVLSWYDNEWGFSCRVKDLLHYMASK